MPAPRSSFWSTLTAFDRTRLAPTMAVRNAIGVAIPLAAGIAAGNPVAGVMGATGALDVAFSDGSDPYLHRGRRMLTAALFVSLAVLAGRLYGRDHAIIIALEAAGAFVVGLLVAVGQTPADIGTITLVTLIVFAASPAPFGKALSSALLALAGGGVQTTLSLALWPVRRYAPESRAVGALYTELALRTEEDAPATEPILAARAALTGLARDRSVEAERYLALFSQAERMRLSLLMLRRLRIRLGRESGGQPDAELLCRALQLAATLLASIGAALTAGVKADPHLECLAELSELSAHLREQDASDAPAPGLSPPAPSSTVPFRHDARWQLDALAGQLRCAGELAAHTTRAGQADFDRQEAAQPWHLRLAGAFAALRANLSLGSAAFRHAVRLAACVAIADILARYLGWQRAYWAPMTVAIVLKPDYSATHSRGVLRLAGTFAGLALATALFHLLAPAQIWQAALITAFVFLMRWSGTANYGLLVTPLTALVVFLFALGGTPPGDLMTARALNTVAGGIIALAAYRLWPTWERTQISESLAALFDAYRDYFQAVRDVYLRPGLEREPPFAARLSRARQAGRLARSNLEASVARLTTEPGVEPARLTAAQIIMANSRRFIHAVMALEAGIFRGRAVPARHAFADFANGVDATLYFLSAYLRGRATPHPDDLPDLREAHHTLLTSGDSNVDRYALVNVESDRVTNSVNSLVVDTFGWLDSTM